MRQNQLKITPELFEELKSLRRSKLDDNGHEIPNPSTTVVSSGIRPPTLKQQIQRLIRSELSNQASDQGFETFEESQDFEIDEDPMPMSGYEVLQEEYLQGHPPIAPSAQPSTETAAPVVGPKTEGPPVKNEGQPSSSIATPPAEGGQ